MHKHHIVFRSQGGLDYDLNMIELTLEEHEGDKGPHRCRERDLELKKNLQRELRDIFWRDTYTIEEISKELGRTVKYFEKHFRKVPSIAGRYNNQDIIKKLMGGRFYE